MNIKEIVVPDVGASEVDVIELLVGVGDAVNVETALVTLESDKASMDVPSPYAGTIKSMAIKEGDKVSEGAVVATIAVNDDNSEEAKKATSVDSATEENPTTQKVFIPDVGGSEVDVIEILVKVGDQVKADTALVTLESDKASMDVPSPYAGVIETIAIKEGNRVSEGALVATMLVANSTEVESKLSTSTTADRLSDSDSKSQTKLSTRELNEQPLLPKVADNIYAGPAVRRLARELGVDLNQVTGTGDKDRVLKQDIHQFVKQGLKNGRVGTNGLNVADAPVVDFSQFGDIEQQPLSKINKLTGEYLHRNWVTIPHVTQFDDADITDMEAFRQKMKAEGTKLTPIVFVIKAVVKALQQMPRFNASLDASGDNLILKKYINIGVAVDTPNGLMVPVLRNADQKSMTDLAQELSAISKKAREKGLSPADMQGGCFAISSLGGIGGTAFTPIVNAPDVAILGLSKSSMKPIWDGEEFKPRLMLPLSLSYDHRVIDGADAARFITIISRALAQPWLTIL